MNDVLCYRGVQCLPPVPRLMPDCESPNAPVNGELCYRGTPVSPSISNSEWEIHHSPVDVTLCYRGIHYWQKQTVVEQSTVPCQVAGTVRPARLVASAS